MHTVRNIFEAYSKWVGQALDPLCQLSGEFQASGCYQFML